MPVLRYPIDRIEEDSDYLQINVIEYKPPGLGRTGGGFFELPSFGGSTTIKKSKGTIILPIPAGLTDMNGVTWNGDQINSIAGRAFGDLSSIIGEGDLGGDYSMENIVAKVKAMADSGKDTAINFLNELESPDVREALKTFFISKAVNVFGANTTPNSLLSRTQGQVLNPNLELLFQGVQLRTFSFEFSFTPRSRAESDQIKAIIYTFKRRMAAKTNTCKSGSKGVFIKSPDVFQLQFKQGSKDHPFLFSMKTCALKNMNVNYTGTGNYAVYSDSTPVKMSMRLDFQELNPVYEEDYSKVKKGVGF